MGFTHCLWKQTSVSHNGGGEGKFSKKGLLVKLTKVSCLIVRQETGWMWRTYAKEMEMKGSYRYFLCFVHYVSVFKLVRNTKGRPP
jgi:hypothetical protein